MKSLITALTILFVSNIASAEVYLGVYAKLKVAEKTYSSNSDAQDSSAVVGLIGYRIGTDKGVSIDVMTSDYGKPGASIGIFSKSSSGVRYNAGLTMIEGIDRNSGYYIGFEYNIVSVRFIKYTSNINVIKSIDYSNPNNTVVKTYNTDIDRAMLWVGVAHNF